MCRACDADPSIRIWLARERCGRQQPAAANALGAEIQIESIQLDRRLFALAPVLAPVRSFALTMARAHCKPDPLSPLVGLRTVGATKGQPQAVAGREQPAAGSRPPATSANETFQVDEKNEIWLAIINLEPDANRFQWARAGRLIIWLGGTAPASGWRDEWLSLNEPPGCGPEWVSRAANRRRQARAQINCK